MKAISLSTNAVIIIVLAVIVLLVLASFLMGGVMPTTGSVDDNKAWSIGCGMWQIRGCSKGDDVNIIITGYDPNGDGKDNNLTTACKRIFGADANCHDRCCAGGGGGGGGGGATTTTIADFCKDETDGGDKPCVAGQCTYEGGTAIDYCLDPSKLNEYYCNANTLNFKLYENLPSGCICSGDKLTGTCAPIC